ncbi:hypothetical protein D9M68_212430 [compost metagenome]
MPTAVMAQPISTAPTSALAAMFCGREKIPPPTIEPTTRATNAGRRSFCADSDIANLQSREESCQLSAGAAEGVVTWINSRLTIRVAVILCIDSPAVIAI